MEKEWINDAVYKCDDCEEVFKVYCLENEPLTSFCPLCGSKNINPVEEDLK